MYTYQSLVYNGPSHIYIYIYVDNLSGSMFLLNIIPSIRKQQDKYDKMYDTELEGVLDSAGVDTSGRSTTCSLLEILSSENNDDSLYDFSDWFGKYCTCLNSV